MKHVSHVTRCERCQETHHLLSLLGIVKQSPLSPGRNTASTLPQHAPDIALTLHPDGSNGIITDFGQMVKEQLDQNLRLFKLYHYIMEDIESSNKHS